MIPVAPWTSPVYTWPRISRALGSTHDPLSNACVDAEVIPEWGVVVVVVVVVVRVGTVVVVVMVVMVVVVVVMVVVAAAETVVSLHSESYFGMRGKWVHVTCTHSHTGFFSLLELTASDTV
jgi:hypothetical protein